MAATTLACWVAATFITPALAAEDDFAQQVGQFVTLPAAAPQSEMMQRAIAAVGHIKAMQLPEASHAINEALQLDARNSYPHFFNGFIYHLQARQGDAQKNDLATEGYEQALRQPQHSLPTTMARHARCWSTSCWCRPKNS